MPDRAEDQGGSRVRVNSVLGGRELIVDGTFASWYNPDSAATGSVWDALVAPLMSLPPKRRKRFLILGLGGGSTARLIRALAPSAKIVGVEMDAAVIKAARQEFGLDKLGIEVVQADGRDFLKQDRHRYDLVIDDIFIGKSERVRKPLWMLQWGVAAAADRVAKGGVLSCNTIRETRKVSKILRESFPSLLRLEVEDYDNRILAASTSSLSGRELRKQLSQEPLFETVLPRLGLRSLK
jgi:precorrin-6B methylase 2